MNGDDFFPLTSVPIKTEDDVPTASRIDAHVMSFIPTTAVAPKVRLMLGPEHALEDVAAVSLSEGSIFR